MSGEERRNKIIDLMRVATTPLSGAALGKQTGVSRQVVVQDIALLRTQGYPIVATPRGYVLDVPGTSRRCFKCHHTNEQTEEELTLIVDLGGCVEDVVVNHRIYGKISAELGIKNRRDVKNFLKDIASGKSTPLLNITSGYHFHHVSAETEEILDEIEFSLKEKGFLTEVMPYEVNVI